MATIRDVAKEASVSVATVSAVINNKPGVSDRARHKVMAAIQALDYRPNKFAQALSNNRSAMIGVLIPSIDNPFFPQVVKSLEDVFFANGYSTFICNTEGQLDKASRYCEKLLGGFVEGLIISLTWELTQPSILKQIKKAKVPVVGMAGSRVVKDFDAVIPDDFQGAFDATAYLIKLGHRRIGFIAAQNSRTSELRLEGYRKALEEHGLIVDEDLVALGKGYSSLEGQKLAKNLLDMDNRPTALFCFNDVMACGALAAAHEKRLVIPDEISVMGFDDSTGEYLFPQLSSVVIPKKEMGFLAGSLLIDRIRKKPEHPQLIKLKNRLVARDSTGVPHS